MTCCKNAGVSNLRFHDLRHEGASRLLEVGWPLQHVQKMLGHADARTTSIYTNATASHLRDSMRRFGTALHELAHRTGSERQPLGNVQPVSRRNPLQDQELRMERETGFEPATSSLGS